MTKPATPPPLRRQVGLVGATMMGLGSILGTGVFVSIGIAAGVTGPSVVLAVAVAAVVATLNALSSAQLAANHPVSGGTYEYGYRWLHPALGFTAGWMFVWAKSASAATAALGLAGYLLPRGGWEAAGGEVGVAMGMVALLTLLVLSGIRRSSQVNIAIVAVTVGALLLLIFAGLPTTLAGAPAHFRPFFAPADTTGSPTAGFLQACALMFVAYTGYGRIATLAEEVHAPRRTIPLAILLTLLLSMALYLGVSAVAVATLGPDLLGTTTDHDPAPLQRVAQAFDLPGIAELLTVGAVTAMAGVLVNLLLGLSRVVLAMGRRGDAPGVFARVGGATATPYAAVLLVGGIVGGLVLVGNVKTTWSFSAFTVLIYYALTNLAALRLTPEERLYPPLIPWLGLAGCLFLAFWVEPAIWASGLGLIAAGLIWHGIARKAGSVSRNE